jgi:hypothetical protein
MKWWRRWRYRRSDEYRTRMAGYWSGDVCRVCDACFTDSFDCDLFVLREKGNPGSVERACDFRVTRWHLQPRRRTRA